MNDIHWHLTVIRLIVPFLIVPFPLFGLLTAMFVDSLDWHLIGVTSDQMSLIYQKWDKAMDLYSFVFLACVINHWQDKWIKRTAFGFLGYRLIGDILFWATGWKPLLFLFPNIFENFAILALLIFWLTKRTKLKVPPLYKISMVAVVSIPKIIHEYFQHFLDHQPWEIYSPGSWLGLTGTRANHIDLITWGTALYALPMAVFLLYTKIKIK